MNTTDRGAGTHSRFQKIETACAAHMKYCPAAQVHAVGNRCTNPSDDIVRRRNQTRGFLPLRIMKGGFSQEGGSSLRCAAEDQPEVIYVPLFQKSTDGCADHAGTMMANASGCLVVAIAHHLLKSPAEGKQTKDWLP